MIRKFSLPSAYTWRCGRGGRATAWGVNIAVQLEGIAKPDSICFSEDGSGR
jgi:hypothetical protein